VKITLEHAIRYDTLVGCEDPTRIITEIQADACRRISTQVRPLFTDWATDDLWDYVVRNTHFEYLDDPHSWEARVTIRSVFDDSPPQNDETPGHTQ
jgi:hypothetical protein